MKRWILGASVALLFFVAPSAVRANAAPPPPPSGPLNYEPHSVKFVVIVDDGVKEPRLDIPASFLVKPDARRGAAPTVPLIVVGLALTAGFVSAGLWLSRRSRSTAALLVAVSLFSLGGGILIANVPPPPQPPKAPVEITLPADVNLPAKVTLQVTTRGDVVRLWVPGSMVPKPAKPEPKPNVKPGEE
jgi:hypothetical protein